jgi:hypothetical protein
MQRTQRQPPIHQNYNERQCHGKTPLDCDGKRIFRPAPHTPNTVSQQPKVYQGLRVPPVVWRLHQLEVMERQSWQ